MAHDEIGGLGVENGLNWAGSGADVVLAEIVHDSYRTQRSRTVGGIDTGAAIDCRRVWNRWGESGESEPR